jgi:Fe-S cluster assembly iron-binding protein IscA
MGWADKYIEQLKAGQTITFRIKVNTGGCIEKEKLCTMAPMHVCSSAERGDLIGKDDIVFAVNHKHAAYIRKVKTIQKNGANNKKIDFLLCSNDGKYVGWFDSNNVHGKCIKIE